jgi:nucleoside-diphosphate-sugar epimerase
MKHTLLITGAAGYVGAMLVEQFSEHEDVERIIGIDKEPLPESLEGIEKLHYLQMNTANAWEGEVARFAPDIVIHTAWQIREIYGNRERSWSWNIDGSDKVFDFAFEHQSVKRLIHFSTVASYGAFASNTPEHRFTEEEPFRETTYLYAEEKRISEAHLYEKYQLKGAENPELHIAVLRPAAVTGPRGRYMHIRFGLQSALLGQLKASFAQRLVSALTAFVPVTPHWLRQFIHEDDVVAIVEKLSFEEKGEPYAVFNICPPGAVVSGSDMACAVGKRVLAIKPWMTRLPFFLLWHLTRGKIPTAPGSWKGYSYPIAVTGEKLTRDTGYTYKYGSYDAFYYTDGHYEYSVPAEQRRNKEKL